MESYTEGCRPRKALEGIQCTVFMTYQWSPNGPTNCVLLCECGLALWLPNICHRHRHPTST